MTSRWLLVVVTAAGLAGAAGCRSPMSSDRVVAGDESISFFGPGRERLDFGRLATIGFEPVSWELSDGEAGRLGAALEVVAGGRRVLLLGVGDENVPPEHGRQQALARALAVRRALVERGGDPARILVSGMSAGEAEGLTGRDTTGPRVECAVVR
jgi:hypothetical protein